MTLSWPLQGTRRDHPKSKKLYPNLRNHWPSFTPPQSSNENRKFHLLPTSMPPRSFKPTRERKARKRVRTAEEGGEKPEAFPDGNNPARTAPNSNVEMILPGAQKPEKIAKEPELPKMSAKKRKRYNKYIVRLPQTTVDVGDADGLGLGNETEERRIQCDHCKTQREQG